MSHFMQQFRKELKDVYTFKDNTVQNYVSIIYKYFEYFGIVAIAAGT